MAIPEDLDGLVERAEAIGRAIYVLDSASAVGTDALLDEVPDPEQAGLAGYLTVADTGSDGRPTGSFRVYFFTDEERPRVSYTVSVSGAAVEDAHVRKNESPEAPSEAVALLIRARQTALGALKQPVQPINPVVVPGRAIGEQGFLVYLLAGTKRPNVAVLGRHYRVVVSPDGGSVKRFEPLSKGILELALESPDMPKGAKVHGLLVTHLVTDYPLETHVFVSLLYGKPLFVGTARGLWKVERGRISFYGPHGP